MCSGTAAGTFCAPRMETSQVCAWSPLRALRPTWRVAYSAAVARSQCRSYVPRAARCEADAISRAGRQPHCRGRCARDRVAVAVRATASRRVASHATAPVQRSAEPINSASTLADRWRRQCNRDARFTSASSRGADQPSQPVRTQRRRSRVPLCARLRRPCAGAAAALETRAAILVARVPAATCKAVCRDLFTRYAPCTPASARCMCSLGPVLGSCLAACNLT
eukprot:IDg19620t1